MQTLADRVAWISGAASGIGLAVAHRLADEKMKLALVDVDADALAAAENALVAKGVQVLSLRVDVSKGEEVASAAKRVRDSLGLAQVVFNNAGIGGSVGPSWLLSEAEWRRTIDVNLWGVIHGIRHLVPPLLESGEEGHVVNTASMAGLTSPPAMAPYVATKHAVVAISECLAKELELAKAKVHVSVLCPGFVKTNITAPKNVAQLQSIAHPMRDKLAMAMGHLVDGGIAPELVADAVVRGIKESKFYLLTHPEMKPAIEHRMKQILAEEKPGIDPPTRALLG